VISPPRRACAEGGLRRSASHVEQGRTENPNLDAYLGVRLPHDGARPAAGAFTSSTRRVLGRADRAHRDDEPHRPEAETGGLSLCTCPANDSESPEFQASDDALRDGMTNRGLKRLFPESDVRSIRLRGIHRRATCSRCRWSGTARRREPRGAARAVAPLPDCEHVDAALRDAEQQRIIALVIAGMERNGASLIPPKS